MKYSILATAMLATLPFGNGPVGAPLSENGPYYANPSWDQTLPASTPFHRIVESCQRGGARPRDRSGMGAHPERFGVYNIFGPPQSIHALCFFTGGRFGWRPPSAAELTSLIDPTQPDGLPAGNPLEGASGGKFWIATPQASTAVALGSPVFAFIVEFISGGIVTEDDKTNGLSYTIWCVRGGPGAQSPQ